MLLQLRDIAKLDQLNRETIFLAREGIITIGQLESRKRVAASKIEALTTRRRELRKELRRLSQKGGQQSAEEVQGQIRA